jgi:hypothetical protein
VTAEQGIGDRDFDDYEVENYFRVTFSVFATGGRIQVIGGRQDTAVP